jgi:hypothetical protein
MVDTFRPCGTKSGQREIHRRSLPCFVDLLLTWDIERKKPPVGAALKPLIWIGKTGCGGLQVWTNLRILVIRFWFLAAD